MLNKKVFELSKCDFLETVLAFENNRTYNNIYCSDLMAFALGHIKNNETILCTVITSINTIAVSSKLNLPAVIYCEGVKPSEDVIEYAKRESICLFASKLNTYETAKLIDLI